MAIVLALRRGLSEPSRIRLLEKYLSDPEPRIAIEAVPALHDETLPPSTRDEAMTALAMFARNAKQSDSMLYRALNANFRLGLAANAESVAVLAASQDASSKLRVEAIAMLGDWAKPAGRDRIMGDWRPLPPRDVRISIEVFRSRLAVILIRSGLGPQGSNTRRRQAWYQGGQSNSSRNGRRLQTNCVRSRRGTRRTRFTERSETRRCPRQCTSVRSSSIARLALRLIVFASRTTL